MEHGYDQAQATRQLLEDAGFTEVFTARDLAAWNAAPAGAGKRSARRHHCRSLKPGRDSGKIPIRSRRAARPRGVPFSPGGARDMASPH